MASKPFRETLWFKKGMLDADLAQVAAKQADGAAADAVDTLPVEDRYLDDGSVTHEDSKLYSVRTGSTQYVPLLGGVAGRPTRDRLPMLVQEMKGQRAKLAMFGAAIAAVIVIITVYVV